MTHDHPSAQLRSRPRLGDMVRLRPPDSDQDLRAIAGIEAAIAERAAPPRITPPEVFAGREGFAESFLGDFKIGLPTPTGARLRDVTPVGGDPTGRLNYRHFSVVMSASRRMALFTAVNIEGARSVSIGRENDRWSFDGRIPVEAQVGEELYVANRLDRGHLVRREDPNWGDDPETANADTFHFTNCSPQMDVVNQKTWLGLENYVLQNARTWKERCSVFTGPVFSSTDLVFRGVRIPKAFWKVVAFLSDGGRPSATAYVVEQEKELGELEAAFAAYKTFQKSIRHVESLSGLTFGALANYDGFSNEEAAGDGLTITAEIRVLGDIRV